MARDGKLAFGTVDSFLLWRLTGGLVHATDATNASRTMLFNIHTQDWDDELLGLFDIPDSMLPQVQDSAAEYGSTDASVLGAAIPVCGIAGDQQAALIGQAGFETGITKSTYGTGCFVIANTGETALQSRKGSIFVAGSAIQWLRDQIKIIDSAGVSAAIAEETGIVENVHVVPAFAGLGAPYWDPDARGAILGLSRDSGINEIVTATLQAVAYQTKDLINAMADDGIQPNIIRVDGGMVANDWFLQFLSDILNLTVERPKNVESTVLGAAYLAGLTSGIFASTEALQNLWRREALFEPDMKDTQRDRLYEGWLDAVARVKT
jgi:glycerol kinase